MLELTPERCQIRASASDVPLMDEWWNRPAPGEGWTLMIDPETGRVTEHWHEHLWLAPFRGLCDLCSDISNGRMRGRDWAFILVVLAIMVRGY